MICEAEDHTFNIHMLSWLLCFVVSFLFWLVALRLLGVLVSWLLLVLLHLWFLSDLLQLLTRASFC